jgi:hypothetical protein
LKQRRLILIILSKLVIPRFCKLLFKSLSDCGIGSCHLKLPAGIVRGR